MITTPFCLYDCDVPCDGATAVIVSRVDRARDLRNPPLRVEAVGRAHRRPAVVGPVRRPDDDGEPRRGGAAVGAHRPEAVRRADGAALRRLLVDHDVVARGARAVRRRRERRVHRRRQRHRARRQAAAQHARRPALRRAGCTATASCTRARRRCGARPATARSRRPPEVGVIGAGGGNTCGCLLLVRD